MLMTVVRPSRQLFIAAAHTAGHPSPNALNLPQTFELCVPAVVLVECDDWLSRERRSFQWPYFYDELAAYEFD